MTATGSESLAKPFPILATSEVQRTVQLIIIRLQFAEKKTRKKVKEMRTGGRRKKTERNQLVE